MRFVGAGPQGDGVSGVEKAEDVGPKKKSSTGNRRSDMGRDLGTSCGEADMKSSIKKVHLKP